MIMIISTGFSLFFGVTGLLIVYKKIMKNIKESKKEWEIEKNRLKHINKVII